MKAISLPSYWESLIKRYVKKAFYEDTRKKGFADRPDFTEGDYRFFVKGVRELNIAFTQERSRLPKNYLNRKEFRSGYILYFLPVNALKVAKLLEQVPQGVFVDNGRIELTIVDVGCGPGTGLLGTMHYLERLVGAKGQVRLQWILLDQNRQALNDALALHDLALEGIRKNHPGWEISSKVTLEARDVFAGKISRSVPKADLILGLNLLNEIDRRRRLIFVEDLLSGVLKDRGRLLLMEPALRSTTRDLMTLRDDLLDRGLGYVHAPCLHQEACPMLRSNDRDWCHTYIPWDRPSWIEKLDRLAAIRKDYLKCSYLLMGREEPRKPSREIWRVVSGPLNSNGKTERLLCGAAALPDLLRATRLDRDANSTNADFGHLERGDRVEMIPTTRVGRETVVKKF